VKSFEIFAKNLAELALERKMAFMEKTLHFGNQ
jgi:hypothetical protein